MKRSPTPSTIQSLLRQARAARAHAHAPYSRFRVGAAVRTGSGRIFTGCNVENSSYSLTVCAERVALFAAIAAGYRTFSAIAVSGPSGRLTPPCGACRQVISDLAGEATIILDKGRSGYELHRASELLPIAFGRDNLRR